MDIQGLINYIRNTPFDGKMSDAARDAFIKKFPLNRLSTLTKEEYNSKKEDNPDTFCYNLEYVPDLPFGIKGASKKKFGNPSSPMYPNVSGIVNMISDVKNGNINDLKERNKLGDIFDSVLIKILSIYLPDKFITIGQKETLTLLGAVLGIKQQNVDLIELNYLCNKKLVDEFPEFAKYQYNQLGNAIWKSLSPQNKNVFADWLKNKCPDKSGTPSSYVTSIERLSLFYKENYFSPDIDLKSLQKLYDDTLLHQREKNGKYYYQSRSYGQKGFYSAAVKSYMEYLKNDTELVPEIEQNISSMPQVYPKNIILYGPPGTGKTYNTIRYALSIIDGLELEAFNNMDNANNRFKDFVRSGRIAFTTFHQSLSYEDFIEGIKPKCTDDKQNVIYEVEAGIFVKLCEEARQHTQDNYVLIIDEINRGNVANIFGELITLIENDKREKESNELSCILPYSKERFSVPSNLYIIGTMNTADRSVEALDSALRRRFDFVEMLPKIDKVKYKPEVLERINKRLRILKDEEHQLGHSYFMNVSDDKDLCDVFQYRVIPMIQEYFFGDMEKIRLVLGDGFCVKETVDRTLFPSNTTDIDIPNDIWRLWNHREWKECREEEVLFTKALDKLMNS